MHSVFSAEHFAQLPSPGPPPLHYVFSISEDMVVWMMRTYVQSLLGTGQTVLSLGIE